MATKGSLWRRWWPEGALLVAALLGWTLILGQAEHSVFGLVPILDEVFYLDRAAELDGLHAPADQAHFMSPLYPILAKAVGADGGVPADRVVLPASLRGLRIFQIICWLGAVILVRIMAERFLPPDAPGRRWLVLLPPLLMAGYLPAAVYALAVLVELPLMLLVAAGLLLGSTAGAPGRRGWSAALALGVVLGLAGLLRGSTLVLVPVALLVATSHQRSGRLVTATLILAGVLATQMPAVLHNSRVEGRPVGPTLNGGVNLVIGNGPEANGFYVAVVPGDWRADPAGRQHLAQTAGRDEVSLGEADRIWAGRAWSEMRARPGRAGALWLKKVWLHLRGWEIDQLTPLDGWRRTVPALRARVVPWFAVVVLAWAGGVHLAVRRPERWWSLILWVATPLAVQSLFFVVTRYRLALLPAGVLLAAVGLAALVRRSRSAWIGAVVGVLVVVPWGLNDVQAHWRAQAMANEAHRWAVLGDARQETALLQRAETLYRHSLDAGAEGAAPWLGLAALLEADGRLGEATDVLTRALDHEGRHLELRSVLVSQLLEAGRQAEAEDQLLALLTIWPGDADALHNLTVLLAGAGRLDDAHVRAEHLMATHPSDPRGYIDLGIVLARRGRSGEAAEVFRRGLRVAPDDERLTENLRRLTTAP